SRASLILLQRGLGRLGYDIITAESGREALQLADENDVDIFVLDVQMPGMSGFETARALHGKEQYRETPIIFLTGEEDIQQRIKGFEAGGVDYIVKPFHTVEVAKRVRIHLELFRRRRESERYADEMESLANERAKQLAHADRLAMLGTLAGGVAHEINNPLSFISGNVQTMLNLWPLAAELLDKELGREPDNAEDLEFVQEEMPEILDGIKGGIRRIAKIVNGLKTYVRDKQEVEREPFQVAECFDGAITVCQGAMTQVKVITEFDESLPDVLGDSQQIEQVLINLCVNASHAMEGRDDQKIWVRAYKNGKFVYVSVEDNGKGIPEENLSSIWDPFFTTKEVGKGTGLGLSICQNIIREHGGDISACKGDRGGAKFTFYLPIASETPVFGGPPE
ncbi:MAG: ATP-binding protein, partial [Myxococcota bacterium]